MIVAVRLVAARAASREPGRAAAGMVGLRRRRRRVAGHRGRPVAGVGLAVGRAAALLLRSGWPAVGIAAGLVWVDLGAMPLAHPAVRLGETWLVGELVAVAFVLVPALFLARWTLLDRHVVARGWAQALCAGGLIVGGPLARARAGAALAGRDHLGGRPGRRGLCAAERRRDARAGDRRPGHPVALRSAEPARHLRPVRLRPQPDADQHGAGLRRPGAHVRRRLAAGRGRRGRGVLGRAGRLARGRAAADGLRGRLGRPTGPRSRRGFPDGARR